MMTLNTKITNQSGNEITFSIETIKNDEAFKYYIYHDANKIGRLFCQLEKDNLRITYMGNMQRSQYKGVGKALHEIAFRTSVSFGKNGKIQLGAGYNSLLFHFKYGYRASFHKKLTIPDHFPEHLNLAAFIHWKKQTTTLPAFVPLPTDIEDAEDNALEVFADALPDESFIIYSIDVFVFHGLFYGYYKQKDTKKADVFSSNNLTLPTDFYRNVHAHKKENDAFTDHEITLIKQALVRYFQNKTGENLLLNEVSK